MAGTGTPYALLGLLTLCPEGATGYDLRRLAERSIGNFWSESYGQIYPALKQLRKAGLVTAREEAAGKRDRTVYALTAAGRRQLAEWLRTSVRIQPPRNEMLLKLFFGPEATPEVHAGHVREVREFCRGKLALMDTIESAISAQHATEPGLPYWLMTIDFGRRHCRMVLEWSEATLRKLEQIGARGKRRRARA
jgi:PadR family transcriptional regulator AphA